MPNYQPGWEGARLAYKSGVSYIPVACITSRSESNATNYNEKVNVCTEGKVVRKPTSISRTVSVSGEVVDAGSLKELRVLQDSKTEQIFRIYDSSGNGDVFQGKRDEPQRRLSDRRRRNCDVHNGLGIDKRVSIN